jgi:predicted nucleotide-binding protein
MTERAPGYPELASLPEDPRELPADGAAAVQQDAAAGRQSVLRRVHDVLNLSVYLGQPAPEGRHARPASHPARIQAATPSAPRRLGWIEQAQLWERARGAGLDAVLGETRVMAARVLAGAPVEADLTDLGQSLDPLLPYREERPPGWWRWAVINASGNAVWDTRLAADTGQVREIVVIGPAGEDQAFSDWVWSDGTATLPPFAQYLLHAAKLRYEDRVLDAWRRDREPAGDIARVVAELDAALSPGTPRPDKIELLRSRLTRLRAEENQLATLKAGLAQLSHTVSIAQRNLAMIPGCEPRGDGRGMFAADHALARWLTGQAENDLHYLQIELDRASVVRARATEELAQAQSEGTSPVVPPRRSGTSAASGQAAPAGRPGISRRVFVVDGRDGALASRFRDLLHIVGLDPLDWNELVAETGSTAPYLGQVVARAPHLAQATLVLLSPDDIVQLHPDLCQGNDHDHERARSCQARPNVYFELGLALESYPDRTVVVEAGITRPVADLAGLNIIRFDGSAIAIWKVLDRLKLAGCPVHLSGTDWMDEGRFAGLAAYRRGPTACPCDRGEASDGDAGRS